MAKQLENYKVAILIADGFEESEMINPKAILNNAGAITHIISPVQDKVRAWRHSLWSDSYKVDIPLDVANPDDYDALLLPGGVMNPDTLRLHNKAVDFVKKMGNSNKPIAAICHGPWTLINANLVKGKTLTSWPSIRVDLENAGVNWIDKEVVVDDQIITSRKPDDLPAFNQAMISLFSKSK